MQKLTLLRVGHDDYGLTQGVLLKDGLAFAVTLELPWRNNQIGNSCIPEGIYTCLRITSPKFGETFQVLDVPGRSHILFHKGNQLTDTIGCILVGEKFTGAGILESYEGFNEFLYLFKSADRFTLEIKRIPCES